MALLDRNAPHVVYVQNRQMIRDEGGRRTWAPKGELERIRCAVQVARDWSSAEESSGVDGLQMLDMRVVISRNWTGDEQSHVRWDGDWYEMVGAPQHLKMSRRTSHWRITMRRVGTAWPS